MVDYSTSPLSTDLYSRVMATGFDEKKIIGVPTLGQVFFGQPETGSETLFCPDSNSVDIDVMRGNEKTAVLVPRGMNGRLLGPTQQNAESERFTNFNRVFPLGEEESDIEAGTLLNRVFDENPYERKTRRERLQKIALKNHQEQVRRFVRLFERLAWASLLTGKMPAILGTADPDLEYDFRRNSAHSVTLGTQWSNVAADAFGDIDDAATLVRNNGHQTADVMFTEGGSFEALLLNTALLANADNRRINMVDIDQDSPMPSKYQKYVGAGAIYRGKLKTPKGKIIFMFTSDEVYTSTGGTATQYIPSGKVLIGYSGARADRYFGPPESLPNIAMRDQFYNQLFGFNMQSPPMPPNIKGQSRVIKPGMFYFDAYAPESWKRATARTQTAPIFATTQTDCWVVIENAI